MKKAKRTMKKKVTAMQRWSNKRAVAVGELVLALAAIGLLLSFGIAAAGRVRQFDSKTQCLANMREIGRASWLYATDDRFEQIVPVTRAHVRIESEIGFEGNVSLSWRLAERFCYGGRTPVTALPTSANPITIMTEPTSIWAEPHRPLNPYVTTLNDDQGRLETFHCPQDRGYPNEAWMYSVPREAANIPCYDFLGSSYAISKKGLAYTVAGGGISATFGTTPFGHAASTIASPPAETVMYAEPMFMELVPLQPISGGFGWHGFEQADNALFLDGSARLAHTGPIREFTQAELEQMGFSQTWMSYYYYFLLRGPDWQVDVNPTPGAYVAKVGRSGFPPYYAGWPFENLQMNLAPE